MNTTTCRPVRVGPLRQVGLLLLLFSSSMFLGMDCGNDDTAGSLNINELTQVPISPSPSDAITITVSEFRANDATPGPVSLDIRDSAGIALRSDSVPFPGGGADVVFTVAALPVGTYAVDVTWEGTEFVSNNPLADVVSFALGVTDCAPALFLGSVPPVALDRVRFGTPVYAPTATVGTPYSYQLVASGTPPVAINLLAGGPGLPPGLTFDDATDLISGTPSVETPETYIILRVSDSCVPPRSEDFTLLISAADCPGTAPQMDVATSLTVAAGEALHQLIDLTTGAGAVLSVTGGSGASIFNVEFDALQGQWALVGTPPSAGTFEVVIQAANACVPPQTSSTTVTIVVTPPTACPALDIATPSLSTATVGVAFSQTLAASGGTGPYTWEFVAPTVPPAWATLSPDGVLSGTPPDTTGSPFSLSIEVTDSCAEGAQSEVKVFSLVVNPAGVASWDHDELLDRFAAPSGLPGEADVANDGTVVVLPDGRPVWVGTAAAQLSGPTGLVVALATTPSPLSTADWNVFALETTSETAATGPSAAIIGGRLAIAYRSPPDTGSGRLRYVLATTDTPTTATDFAITDLETGGFGATQLSPGRGLIELDGLPVFVFAASQLSHLRCARASVAVPTGPTDWTIHNLVASPGSRIATNPQVVVYNDQLVVGFVEALTAFATVPTAAPAVAIATSETPAGPADWAVYPLQAHAGLLTRASLAVSNSRLNLVVGTGDGANDGQSVHLWRTAVASPLLATDWTDTVLPIDGVGSSGFHCDAIDYSGRLLIAVGDHPGAPQQVRVARALVADPTDAASDWLVETVESSLNRPTSPHLAVCGGLPRVEWVSHWDEDIYFGTRSEGY